MHGETLKYHRHRSARSKLHFCTSELPVTNISVQNTRTTEV